MKVDAAQLKFTQTSTEEIKSNTTQGRHGHNGKRQDPSNIFRNVGKR